MKLNLRDKRSPVAHDLSPLDALARFGLERLRACDVAVAVNGDISVADGRGGDANARIAKFSQGGKFIKA